MRIETKRLILREWSSKDADDLVEGLNDLEVSKWLATTPYPYTRKDAISYINASIKNSKTKDQVVFDFAIELKSEKKVIGGTNISIASKFSGLARGGIWINSKYHGEGYGLEAFSARAEFAFKKLKLRRLENGFFEGNKESLKMQEKLGYRVEGLKRQALKCMADGKIKNEVITALLKEDWKKI